MKLNGLDDPCSRNATASSGPPRAGADARPERIGFGALEGIMGLHVSLGNMAIVQHFKQSLEALKLTQKQTAVLWLAEAHPGVVQVDLASLFRLDRATMLGIVNSLARRGLIERRPVAYHGRRLGLHLTPDGSELLARAKQAVEMHEMWVKSRFSPRELALLVELMKRLYDDTAGCDGDGADR